MPLPRSRRLVSSTLSTLKLNYEGVIKRILVHVDDYAVMREIVDTTLRSDEGVKYFLTLLIFDRSPGALLTRNF
jgi:hypothetical protein